jgi:hypothetical protein
MPEKTFHVPHPDNNTILQQGPPPSVYITGGVQSPDIIISIRELDGSIVDLPDVWSTILQPYTDYVISARVHNNSTEPLSEIRISFWKIPGGEFNHAALIQNSVSGFSVPVAPGDSGLIQSIGSFVLAPEDGWALAAVGIFGQHTGCNGAPSAIPGPGILGAPSCSAWRFTTLPPPTAGSDGLIGHRPTQGPDKIR